MGTTPRPLKLLVSPTIFHWDEIKVLIAQKHLVDPFGAPTLELSQYDAILAENGWMMDEAHRGYLETAIKAIRLKRYGKKDGA